MRRVLAALPLAATLVLASFAGPAGADDAAEASYVLTAPASVSAGDMVGATLTAKDEDGTPLAGLAVRFVRTGPGAERAESCSVEQLTECTVTWEGGVAWYGFGAGPLPGVVQLRAEVYGPDGALVAESGPHDIEVRAMVVCRAARTSCPPLPVRLFGRSKSPARDVLSVLGPSVLRRNEVLLQTRVRAVWRPVGRIRSLDRHGDTTFSVPDRNRDSVTKYRAIVLPGARSPGDISHVVRLH